jgi:hypothetical protein
VAGGGTHAHCEPDKVHPGPGIRNFKPTLRKAAERLATVHTPDNMPLPPNALAELQRDMARLGFVVSQIREIEDARQKRLEQQPETGPHAMVRLLARIVGVGVETADMLVHELLSRPMRDRKAVARYAGLTGSPDESGAQRREQGLARAGNARVRRGMIQLAWRFLMFQKESALVVWYRARTADSRIGTRKTMIVALARKLVIALWRFVATGGRRLTSSVLKRRAYRNEHTTQHHSALALAFQPTAELTIRGGGKPYSNMALMPSERMGLPPGAPPPMRMTASWLGQTILPNTSLRHQNPPIARSPRILRRQPASNAGAFAKKSPCHGSSSLRVLRPQGAAKHKRR